MRVIGSFGEPRSQRNGWSQNLGDYVELLYHGTADYARGVFASLRGNCSECDLDVDGMSGIVRARFSSTTEPGGEEQLRVDIRLGRNDVQKSIFEPGPDGFNAGVSSQELRYIKALIDDPLDDIAFTWLADNATPAGEALYALAEQGTQYRTVYQPVLAQVTTASNLFQWPAINYLAGSILSDATMLGLLRQAPNFTIPSDQPTAAPSGFSYGWKMAPPNYESSSDGHSSEVLEFEFGLWPTQIYGTPI